MSDREPYVQSIASRDLPDSFTLWLLVALAAVRARYTEPISDL